MGLLVVNGTLDLGQYWSNGGESDGDTSHVLVKSITFNGKATNVFKGAHVKGRGSKDVIDKNGKITVRWQGIDTPELHYTPTVSGPKAQQAHNFRQHFGQSATLGLLAILKELAKGKTSIDVQVTSNVEHPNDVFDTYGRMIGTIIANTGKKDVDLNAALVREGWAFPTFYSSMTPDEITALRDLADDARRNKRGIWKDATTKLQFDPDLRFQASKKGGGTDDGPVLMPKIFRRLSTMWVAKGDIDNFRGYLDEQAKPDRAYLTDEFLEEGIHVAVQHKLSEFVQGDRFSKRPDELVFQEASSTLYDANGNRTTKW